MIEIVVSKDACFDSGEITKCVNCSELHPRNSPKHYILNGAEPFTTNPICPKCAYKKKGGKKWVKK